MKLSQLRYLIQVAETGSFTRAATTLNVAQPALSRQIKLLEEELGVLLFRRDGRGVEPTAAGRELVRRSMAVFNDLYEMQQAVMSFRGQAAGDVTIGVLPLFGATVLPTLLLRCRERYPGLTVRLKVGMSEVVREWLTSGRIDFGVVSSSVDESRFLRTRSIARDELRLVTRPEAAPAREGPVSLEEALAMELVIPTTNNGIRAVIDSYAGRRGLAVRPAIEVDSIEIIKGLIPTGDWATLLPKFAIEREVGAGVLTSRPITDPAIEYQIDIVTAAERPMSGNAMAVAEILGDIAGEIIGN